MNCKRLYAFSMAGDTNSVNWLAVGRLLIVLQNERLSSNPRCGRGFLTFRTSVVWAVIPAPGDELRVGKNERAQPRYRSRIKRTADPSNSPANQKPNSRRLKQIQSAISPGELQVRTGKALFSIGSVLPTPPGSQKTKLFNIRCSCERDMVP